MLAIEHLLLGASILLVLSILASKASGRLGVPGLLLFLLIGMLAGSDGPGSIYFDDPRLAQSLGVVALTFILFAGGMDTHWTSVRPIVWQGIALSTVGVFITALFVGRLATILLGFSTLEGLLLGAIISSTDAAAVFAILRSRNVGLKANLEPLLEFESGSNDPMAIFLTIGFIHLIVNPVASWFDLLPMFVLQMALGATFGYGMGKGMVWLVNHLRLEYEGLYAVLTLSLVLLTYSATATLGGNGFLAVYLAGLVMGNRDFVHKKSMMRFHDGLAWLMQIAMFLTLGLLVFPSRLVPIAGMGLLVSVFLMLVARPLGVFITLTFARLNVKEKTMLAWVGLRGAAPIILATFPLLAGIPKADTIFNLVFFIVLTSVLIQGTTIPFVAHWLGVDAPAATKFRYPLEFVPSVNVNSQLVELVIPHDSPSIGQAIVHLGLPKGALVVLIGRDEDTFVPDGGTVLQAGDTMFILADKESLAQAQTLLQKKSSKEKMS